MATRSHHNVFQTCSIHHGPQTNQSLKAGQLGVEALQGTHVPVPSNLQWCHLGLLVSSEHVPIPQPHASPKPSSERSAVWLCLAGLSLQREDLISVLQILRADLSILGQVETHPAGRDVPMELGLSPSRVWTDPPTLCIWERENAS